MTAQEHILGVYGSIATVTGQMVDAAKSSDWDRLVALEHDCRALIETLKHSGAGARENAQFTQSKIALIRKVLADDAEIRRHTEPSLARLESLLHSAGNERRLVRAYGRPSDE